ncbi:MAG: hypothetical protein KGY99_06135 [Phycisphaerae bacterium]|nr:hypothetical protein [Phycisphaerae bacterium]
MNTMRCFIRATSMLCVIGCGDQKVRLSPMPAPGRHVGVLETDMAQTFEGGPADGQSQDVRMAMHMRTDVGEPDAEGRRVLTVTFDRIRHEIRAGGRSAAASAAVAPVALRASSATAAATLPLRTVPPYSSPESVQRMGTG